MSATATTRPRDAPTPPGGIAPSAERAGDTLVLRGALTTEHAARLWPCAVEAARGARALDLSGVEALDTTGAALVLRAADRCEGGGERAELRGASPPVAAVLARARAALDAPRPATPEGESLGPLSAVGAWGVAAWGAAQRGLAFLGEATLGLAGALLRPDRLRWRDVLRHLDESGTRAFPLTVLLGVLIGIILAFQAAVSLRTYGGEAFVPQMVGVSLLRELGPLMAGVILSGRTASAHAAELGTMTVNEEVDALRTMGVDPMAMLVVPRLIAGVAVMPVLALLLVLSGLLGMMGVMATLGYTAAAVVGTLEQWLALNDFLGSMAKSVAFGLAITGIGCAAGLAAGRGPRAVGDAATTAVVGGIVATVVLDGVFAVLFFRLGL